MWNERLCFRTTLFAALLLILTSPANPAAAQGSKQAPAMRTKINPKDGAVMVYIPVGEFLMGDDDIPDNPRHKVTLSGYWIYKNVVTVAQYKKFCRETRRKMPEAEDFNKNWKKENHPIVDVSWDDAKAYCAWAGVRLPTEAQWEKAARGTDGRKFPWGNEFDATKLQCSKSLVGDAGGTAAVGSFPSNLYGLHGMAGNVWQLCLDTDDENFWKGRAARAVDPANTGPGAMRVLRGGGWDDNDPGIFRCAFRNFYGPQDRYGNVGFRCAGTP